MSLSSSTRTVMTALTLPRTTAALRDLLREHSFVRVLSWWAVALIALAACTRARSNADNIGLPVHGSRMETQLFGSLPTVWLQEHVYSLSPNVFAWGVAIVHASWFFVPLLVAAFVSWRRPQRIGSFFRWWIALQTICVLLFALIPTEPPWMASSDVTRLITIHFGRAATDPNPLAAMPSLHVALPLVISLWFFRERWKAPAFAMLGYTLLIAFEVVFSGEHYVVDVMGAGAVAAFVFLAARLNWVEAYRSLRRTAGGSAAEPALQAMRRAGQGERGQGLIEFALLLPILLVFLVVMVDFGIAVDHRLVMQHAVSEGVREAAFTGGTSASALTDIQTTTAGQSQGLVAASVVKVCYIDASVPLNGNAGDIGDKVRVSAKYTYQFTAGGGELMRAFGVTPPTIDMEPVYTTALQVPVTGANACS